MDNLRMARSSIGTIDHIVDSSPELTLYCVAFSGEWDKGYIRESALELVVKDNGPYPDSPLRREF